MTSGSRLTFQKDDKELSIEIRDARVPSSATLSLGESLYISLQACKVNDANSRDLSRLFSGPVQVRLHELSRSLSIVGQDDVLAASIAMSNTVEDSIQLMFKQSISAVDFSKTAVFPDNALRQSTLHRLAVQRNFPLESLEFKSRGAGDLEVHTDPDDFVLYDLSVTGTGLQARLGAKLSSLRVSQGAITTELVPGLLSFITKNTTTSIVITWLGWILTIFIPLFTKLLSGKS